MLKIINNPDKELRDESEKQLQENMLKYGARYCPCALEHNADWICPCKEFIQCQSEGECHCGRYLKIRED